MAKQYKIIAVENIWERKDDILMLWKRNLYDCPERFAWLYEQNPLGPAYTWLAIHHDTGEAVGCGSLYPWFFNINGKPIRVGVAVDYCVDAAHRVYGPAVRIQRAITTSMGKNGFELLFVYPNEASSSSFKRAGYIPIGSSKTWVKLVKSEFKVAEYIKTRPLARIVGRMIDAALYVREKFHQMLESRSLDIENLDTETVDSCDYRFDILWEECQTLHSIIPYQNSKYLNWRYTECKTSCYKYFCLCDKNSRKIKCFIVYSLKDNYIAIKNIFPSLGPYILYTLFLFSKNIKREGNDYIVTSYYGNSVVEDMLKKMNFVCRENERNYFICVQDSIDDETKKTLLSKDNYCFFYG